MRIITAPLYRFDIPTSGCHQQLQKQEQHYNGRLDVVDQLPRFHFKNNNFNSKTTYNKNKQFSFMTNNTPLPFNINANRYCIATIRSGIASTISNLQVTEAHSQQEFAAGCLTAARSATQHQNHRNQVQLLSQLANQHAHLCHDFESSQLVFTNIAITEDPTCQRAIIGCALAIWTLGTNDPDLVHPSFNHRPISNIVYEWYSPGFNCDNYTFHHEVWKKFIARHTDGTHDGDDATFTTAAGYH